MAGYAATLRSAFLHSADVLPDEVAEYLRVVAAWGSDELRQEVLGHSRHLADHIPSDFVDFALSVLLGDSDKPRRGRPSRREDESTLVRLGFPYFQKLFPAAPTQGPFLYLLRTDEDQGLRLVHGLANEAVARWRERAQQPRDGSTGVTPIPITIELPSGRREFWGDERVYYWFRPESWAPDAVASALMALEVWMEQQLEDGLVPDELFEKVLAASDCVAVLGICLGLALASPERSLRAALPLVTSPAIWHFERARWIADNTPRMRLPADFRDVHVDAINDERSKRPQRAMDVRSLAPYYLFGEDGQAREAFQRAAAEFTQEEVLPAPFAEWRQSSGYLAGLREEMEGYQSFADPSNYRWLETDRGRRLVMLPPEHIRQRNEAEVAQMQQAQLPGMLILWAEQTLEAAASAVPASEAIRLVRDLEREGDGIGWEGVAGRTELQRQAAIVGVASAALATGTAGSPGDAAHEWAIQIALSASRVEQRLSVEMEMAAPYHVRSAAVRGLVGAATHGAVGQDIREEIITRVADVDWHVRNAAINSLPQLWSKDPSLCWVAISLAVSLALEPPEPPNPIFPVDEHFARKDALKAAKDRRRADLVARAIVRLRRRGSPTPPRIPVRQNRKRLIWGNILAVLNAIGTPEALSEQADRARVLTLVDDLMAWTLARNRRRSGRERFVGHDREPDEWNRHFLGWLARLTELLAMEETQKHILEPLRRAWEPSPQLTAPFMDGFLRHRLASSIVLTDDVVAIWKAVCGWVVQSSDLQTPERPYRYLAQGVADAAHLVVAGTPHRPLLGPEWPHARLFADILDQWIATVHGYSEPYAYLLTYFGGPAWTCAPEPMLRWLDETTRAVDDAEEFWADHGNREATAILVQRIWSAHSLAIRGEPESLSRLSAVVDRLVSAGSPVASALQQILEHPGN